MLAGSGLLAAQVDFNRDVRPILSERCFKCHGFDEAARKAKLRLDTADGLLGMRKDGAPVVPSDPTRSLLIQRIEHTDPDEVMPPTKAGVVLTAQEKATLRAWVEQGAPITGHWAFAAPKMAPLPPARGSGNPVDRFIRKRLVEHGVTPAPRADLATLLRRASLDLTGLPPTPEQLAAFVAESADAGVDAAYEHALDRLFASPHHGERMALMWLDVARYADTNGFHHDNVRTSWPYRDWVIDAFNRNLPYDRFVVEQLAGDLLPDATDQQRIATAFCRMHNINDEGGALDAEYRVEAVCDRIETIATSFMAMTFTCVRCHDHKFDPFTQEDYYSLYATFGSVEERGVYSANFDAARAYPARLDFKPASLQVRIDAASGVVAAAAEALAAATPDVARERDQWETRFRSERGVYWAPAAIARATTASGGAFELLPDGSARTAANPAQETHVFELETDEQELNLLALEILPDEQNGKGSVGLPSHGNAVLTAVKVEVVSRTEPTRVVPVPFEWAWAQHEQPNGDFSIDNVLIDDAAGWALDGHRRSDAITAIFATAVPFGFAGGSTVRVRVEYRSRYENHVAGRLRLRLGKAVAALSGDFPTVLSDWWQAGPFKAKSYAAAFEEVSGPEREARLDRDAKFGKVGYEHRPAFVDGRTHALKGERSAIYLAREIRTPQARRLRVALGSDDGLRVYLNGQEVHRNPTLRGVALAQDLVDLHLRAGENVLVLKVVNDGGPTGFAFEVVPDASAPSPLRPAALLPPDLREPRLDAAFAADFGRAQSPTYARLADAVEGARAELTALEAETVPVLVMQELPKAKPTFVLARGHYEGADPDRPVTRRPPRVLGGEFPPGAPADRLGFAQWLTQPDHPLTARVHVNRIWQMLFGTGIVKTTENFGAQADWPSHPELLDWLAVWFVKSGWDQRALLRLLVSSATYRQSAVVDPEAKAADPENRLLAYFPRRRLQGEFVRDQALFVSGLLNEDVGGPSVRPYQPDGLWAEVSIGASSNTQRFMRDEGAALYRRSLYTFWKRTSPNPQMATFGAPTREFCQVRRETTNTPLQALVLWNDVQFLEAARLLAQRTLQEASSDAERLTRMFARCTGRDPGEVESAVLQRTLDGFRARYRADVAAAEALLTQGEAAPDASLPAAERAAFMMVANTILALDETLVRD